MILTPEIVFRKIECIHPDYLKAHGITALVLDVDNTLTGDNSLYPSACARARREAADNNFTQYPSFL